MSKLKPPPAPTDDERTLQALVIRERLIDAIPDTRDAAVVATAAAMFLADTIFVLEEREGKPALDKLLAFVIQAVQRHRTEQQNKEETTNVTKKQKDHLR